jgi:hypothetical protein
MTFISALYSYSRWYTEGMSIHSYNFFSARRDLEIAQSLAFGYRADYETLDLYANFVLAFIGRQVALLLHCTYYDKRAKIL